ncbi:hypothetical protein ZEAMMB73_Zm00001d046582 [Zea mays]|uniref:Uncharacterized protein n=1 Tax=Zea mays TaxID=4577 RepID=A0A1D6P3R1_MAIZE|nr:hypothetical protein ZEAMMB73_Zm00001d046582 [Zea mays]AQL04613.1 hypothetical protein ZEAMMB73_Zm00001d046582 [Zea mays]
MSRRQCTSASTMVTRKLP